MTGPEPRPGSRRVAWTCAGLAAVTVAVFAPVVAHGFVSWDDAAYV